MRDMLKNLLIISNNNLTKKTILGKCFLTNKVIKLLYLLYKLFNVIF